MWSCNNTFRLLGSGLANHLDISNKNVVCSCFLLEFECQVKTFSVTTCSSKQSNCWFLIREKLLCCCLK